MIAKALAKVALKWLLIAAAFIALLSALNFGLGYVPFTPQFNAKRTAASAKRLEAQVSSLERTATGNAEIGQAVETYHTREVVYRDLQTQAEIEARTAPDADAPLSAERLARLRRHDGRVCLDAAFTCSTIDAASGRSGALPADDPAGERDAG